jgi:hypothetical protein
MLAAQPTALACVMRPRRRTVPPPHNSQGTSNAEHGEPPHLYRAVRHKGPVHGLYLSTSPQSLSHKAAEPPAHCASGPPTSHARRARHRPPLTRPDCLTAETDRRRSSTVRDAPPKRIPRRARTCPRRGRPHGPLLPQHTPQATRPAETAPARQPDPARATRQSRQPQPVHSATNSLTPRRVRGPPYPVDGPCPAPGRSPHDHAREHKSTRFAHCYPRGSAAGDHLPGLTGEGDPPTSRFQRRLQTRIPPLSAGNYPRPRAWPGPPIG